MAELRPQQLEISTGSADNDTVTTEGFVNENSASALKGINVQTGTTYTATATDLNTIVSMTNIGDKTFILPEDSTENLDVGFYTQVQRAGSGLLTIAPEGSDVLQSAYGTNQLRDVNSIATAVKTASGQWLACGNILDFIPTDFPGLEVWYDASTTNGVTRSGSNVTAWLDQSGNSRDLLQGTTLSQSTYIPSLLNGLGGIRFDGSNDFLSRSFSLSQPLTYFMVVKYVTVVANSACFFGYTNVGNRPRLYNLGGSYYAYAGAGITGGTVDTNPHYMQVEFNGTSGVVREDGSTVASGDIGTNATDGLTVARNPAGSQYGNIEAYELFIYNNILSANDSATANGYLKKKWGL